MYIVTTSYYPSEKATEVGKVFLKMMEKFPPDESLGNQIVPAAVSSTINGVQVIGIFEVNNGKLQEALSRTVKRMAMLMAIPEYEYSVDIHYNAAEAFEVVGMSLPE